MVGTNNNTSSEYAFKILMCVLGQNIEKNGGCNMSSNMYYHQAKCKSETEKMGLEPWMER